MNSLEKQIQALELELDTFSRTGKRLVQLKQQLKGENLRKKGLENKVDKEYQDIVELKKKSIMDIFFDMQEERKRKLKKEHEDYHKALLEFKKQERTIEAIQFEINILEEKLKKLPEKKRQLAKLIQKKPQILLDNRSKSKLKDLEKTTISQNKLRQSVYRSIEAVNNQQILLAEIDHCLDKIGTWGASHLPEREKNKIYKAEFTRIFNLFDRQNIEMEHFKSELEHLWSLEKIIDLDFQSEFEHLEIQWEKLKKEVDFFIEYTFTENLSPWGLQQYLIKISAKIKSLDYKMDQEVLLLKKKGEQIKLHLNKLLLLKKELIKKKN